MALKKVIEQPSGLSCEYHKIAIIEIIRGSRILCHIETYKDQAARDAGKQPAKVQSYEFPESEVNWANNFVSQCYDKVKAALFANAENV